MRRFDKTGGQGFTLIELMTTVVIVAILGMVAFPAYRQYAQRAQRADATSALLRLATAQEKFFLQNNTYTLNTGAPPVGLGIAASDHGYYNLAVAAGGAGIGLSYTATATPPGGSPQFDDTVCRNFAINEQGTRTATDSGGGDTTAECW